MRWGIHFVLTQHRILLVGCLMLCVACSSKPYKTQAFSFPPNKSNAKYQGTISFSCKGNPEERNVSLDLMCREVQE